MTKTTRNNTKKLLSINSKALQGLHAFAGYDFTKDYTCIYSKNNFTAKSIYKVTGGQDAVLLVQPDVTYEKIHLVKFNAKTLTFEQLRFVNFKYWDFDFSYFFTKGDFEENRKGKAKYYFIIFQNPEHIQPVKAEKTIDTTQRFKTINESHKNTCYDTCYYNGVEYITTIYLQESGGSSKIFEYNKHGMYVDRSICRSNDIRYYIDKSGYIVNIRRDELKRKAENLRAERNKIQAQKADFSEEENAIKQRIETVKKYLSTEILKITNTEQADQIEKNISNLRWALFGYKQYQIAKAGCCFLSIEQRQKRLDEINNKLSKITEGKQC